MRIIFGIGGIALASILSACASSTTEAEGTTEEDQQQICPYYDPIDDPISLESCSSQFAECYQSGYNDRYLCEGCSLVEFNGDDYLQMDADCGCTCCWLKYLQNYCFKSLCEDKDEYVRLFEFTKLVCEKAPERDSMKPYVAEKKNGLEEYEDLDAINNPLDHIDIFVSDYNTLSRSLIPIEKDHLFDTLAAVFDFSTVAHDSHEPEEEFEESEEPEEIFADDSDDSDDDELYDQDFKIKRENTELDSSVEAANTLDLYKEDLSLEILQDLSKMYKDDSTSLFAAVKQVLGDEKFELFKVGYEDSSLELDNSSVSKDHDKNSVLAYQGHDLELNPMNEYSLGFFEPKTLGCLLRLNELAFKTSYCKELSTRSCQCLRIRNFSHCFMKHESNIDSDIIEQSEKRIQYLCNDTKKPSELQALANVMSPESKYHFIDSLKPIASQLGFIDVLNEYQSEFLYQQSIQASLNTESGISVQNVILDMCELPDNVTSRIFQFDSSSCNLASIFTCKNKSKSRKCHTFKQETNGCNVACCLEIRSAECAEQYCSTEKPVERFKALANLICANYSDSHITGGKAPFPEVGEWTEVEDDCEEENNPENSISQSDHPVETDFDISSKLKRSFDLYKGDEDSRFNESVCELEPFTPGYDLTKCDRREVKDCIKEGIQNLIDFPEYFCPYCENSNSFDECRCACCFARYFSKVCYDPNCVILSEKLRYKRYMMEVCKTRPKKYLFARDPFHLNLDGSNHSEGGPKKKTASKPQHLEVPEFDIFSDFDDSDELLGDSDLMPNSPVNVNQLNLYRVHKSGLRNALSKDPKHQKRSDLYSNSIYLESSGPYSLERKGISDSIVMMKEINEDDEKFLNKRETDGKENSKSSGNSKIKKKKKKKKLVIDRTKPRRAQKANQRKYHNKIKNKSHKIQKKNKKNLKIRPNDHQPLPKLSDNFGLNYNSDKKKPISHLNEKQLFDEADEELRGGYKDYGKKKFNPKVKKPKEHFKDLESFLKPDFIAKNAEISPSFAVFEAKPSVLVPSVKPLPGRTINGIKQKSERSLEIHPREILYKRLIEGADTTTDLDDTLLEPVISPSPFEVSIMTDEIAFSGPALDSNEEMSLDWGFNDPFENNTDTLEPNVTLNSTDSNGTTNSTVTVGEELSSKGSKPHADLLVLCAAVFSIIIIAVSFYSLNITHFKDFENAHSSTHQ